MLPITLVIIDRWGGSELNEYLTLQDARDGLERLQDAMEDCPSLSLHHAIEALRESIPEASHGV
jgi:hypothetical protein